MRFRAVSSGLLLSLIFLLGCAGGASSISVKKTDPKLLVVPGEKPCSPEKAKRIREILGRTVEIRGLESPGDVSIMTVDKAGLRKFMIAIAEEEWTEKEENQIKALKMFGLIPADMDVKSWLVDLMVENVAGFFNVKSGKVYCMAGSSSDDSVWAHELTHLLDDRTFGLEAMQEKVKHDSDNGLAVEALVEGSATGVMVDFMLTDKKPKVKDDTVTGLFSKAVGRKGMELALRLSPMAMKGKFAESPLIIQRLLLFPYQAGLVFRNRLHAHGGNAAVDSAFANPPESTEQVLHPQRYHLLGKADRPHDVTLPKPPKGWTLDAEDCMGMLGVQVLLEQVSGKWYTYMAEGWDGDRFALWSTPTGNALGWVSVWDYERQAERFTKWLEGSFLNTVGGGTVVRDGNVIAVIFGKGASSERATWLLKKTKVRARKGDHRPPSLTPLSSSSQ